MLRTNEQPSTSLGDFRSFQPDGHRVVLNFARLLLRNRDDNAERNGTTEVKKATKRGLVRLNDFPQPFPILMETKHIASLLSTLFFELFDKLIRRTGRF